MRPSPDILFWYNSIDLILQSLVCSRPFLFDPFVCLSQNPEARSTGSKQTLNGLFIFITRSITASGQIYNVIQRYFIQID